MVQARLSTRCMSKLSAERKLRFIINTQALYDISDAIKAWQKALDTLPKDNLTPAQLKQREQYETGLKAAKLKAEPDTPSRVITIPATSGQHPWQVAKAMEPELQTQGINLVRSSVCRVRLLLASKFNSDHNRLGSFWVLMRCGHDHSIALF